MKAWDYRIKNEVVKLKTIAKLGVMSIAKMQSLITGALYLLTSVAATILGKASPEAVQQAGIQIGAAGIVYYTIAGIIGGFIAGALIALVYNAIAPSIGGIQVELK